MSLRARLAVAQLPSRTVVLAPAVPDGEPDEVTVRALPGDEWDALVQLHPPTERQREEGWGWNLATFRPALLAACVVTPDGEEPLTEVEWAELLVRSTVGDREALFGAAIDVNENRWPGTDVGKG